MTLLVLAAIVGTQVATAASSPEAMEKIERQRRLRRLGVLERKPRLVDARRTPLIDGGPSQGEARDRSREASQVDDRPRAASQFSGTRKSALPSPGLAIGLTYYDYQHNASQGYQVGRLSGSDVVHFCWTAWDHEPASINDADRFVHYNSWDDVSMTLNQGFNGSAISLGDFARAGFCELALSEGNLARVAYHQKPDPGSPLYTIWSYYFPAEGSDISFPSALSLGMFGELTWPRTAVNRNTGSDDVVHVIARQKTHPDQKIVYWRYDAATAGPWAGPVEVGTSDFPGYVVAADPNSDKVAVVLHTEVGGLRQIAYYESITEGLDWIMTGFTGLTVITNYTIPPPLGPEAFAHISAAYDNAGDLHIIWDEQRFAGTSEEVAIRHWVGGSIRPVVYGYYENDGISAFNLNLAKITMGIGDGSTLCDGGATDNTDYLYVLYTKFGGETAAEQSDVSAAGYANGELYLTVSADNGCSWSPPENLTNTKTPGCNGIDSCSSEHWASIGQVVSDIDILYILDRDAGGIPQNEGAWTLNDVMYYQIPGGTTDAPYVCPTAGPNIFARVSRPTACPEHLGNIGFVTTEELTISNLGNIDLIGSVSVLPGATWLSLSAAGLYAVPTCGQDVTMDVFMDATALVAGMPPRSRIFRFSS
ncbi:MAG: hypothetical protein IIA44_12080 [Acidobacteria bacterium]|nr:hypothetical protein [Acidobacteriota bacterium]